MVIFLMRLFCTCFIECNFYNFLHEGTGNIGNYRSVRRMTCSAGDVTQSVKCLPLY